MKFKDLKTGLMLETENDFVIEQYKKRADRFEEVKTETVEPKKENKARKKAE